jgi:hypothetical protein
MKIPAKLTLLGTTYSIKTIPVAKWPDGEETVAYFDPQKALIALKAGLSPDLRMHAFLHELMHAIYYAMGHALYSDESHIDLVAGLLHQALK